MDKTNRETGSVGQDTNLDLDWLDFLEDLAGQAAIVIDNSEVFNQLQRSNLQLTPAYAADLRRSRYLGLAKTHLQNLITAAAINLQRVAAWLDEQPLAQTRQSPFAALAVANA